MTRKEKIAQLRELIAQLVTPLIGGDYVLLDLPYHSNVGDTLIWEGELRFLRSLPHRMLGYGSMQTWGFPRLGPSTTVLLHGGGNFGDVWRAPQEFRLRVLERYPGNRVVMFPQTVHYDDPAVADADARAMAAHPGLTLCARDRKSYDFLCARFRNDVLMVPDMALCIPAGELEYRGAKRLPGRTLVIGRTDKEKADDRTPPSPTDDLRDWPTIEFTTPATRAMYKAMGAGSRIPVAGGLTFGWMADRIAMNRVRPANIRAGVGLLGPYDRVVSDRLHGAILALLMDKPDIRIADNNYGKNSAFFDTWLEETEGVSFIFSA